jgi:hypothetical protein
VHCGIGGESFYIFHGRNWVFQTARAISYSKNNWKNPSEEWAETKKNGLKKTFPKSMLAGIFDGCEDEAGCGESSLFFRKNRNPSVHRFPGNLWKEW